MSKNRQHNCRYAIVIMAFVSACSNPGLRDEDADATLCTVLRNHLVELRLASMSVDTDAHRAALKQSLGDSFIRHCQEHLSAHDVECAVSATNLTDATGCTTDVER
jgi:hypothetical protein